MFSGSLCLTITPKRRKSPGFAVPVTMSLYAQVFTFTWREDIRPGDPQHTKKFCFDAISHTSPVTLYDCHSMKGNQLWKYRQVRQAAWAGQGNRLDLEKDKQINTPPCLPPSPRPEPTHSRICPTNPPCPTSQLFESGQKSKIFV